MNVLWVWVMEEKQQSGAGWALGSDCSRSVLMVGSRFPPEGGEFSGVHLTHAAIRKSHAINLAVHRRGNRIFLADGRVPATVRFDQQHDVRRNRRHGAPRHIAVVSITGTKFRPARTLQQSFRTQLRPDR